MDDNAVYQAMPQEVRSAYLRSGQREEEESPDAARKGNADATSNTHAETTASKPVPRHYVACVTAVAVSCLQSHKSTKVVRLELRRNVTPDAPYAWIIQAAGPQGAGSGPS